MPMHKLFYAMHISQHGNVAEEKVDRKGLANATKGTKATTGEKQTLL